MRFRKPGALVLLVALGSAACEGSHTTYYPAWSPPPPKRGPHVEAAAPSPTEAPARAPRINKCPGEDVWADFRTPPRRYDRTAVAGFEAQLELDRAGKRSPHVALALKSLERGLRDVERRVPRSAYQQLTTTRLFVMRGGEAGTAGCPGGGEYRGAFGNPIHDNDDPLWAHSVVFYSAKNLNDGSISLPLMIHELAHSLHSILAEHVSERIERAYQHALGAGLYRNVREADGTVDAQAYALKNPSEYFAEVSAMYFSRNWRYPFDRAGLLRYDPEGAALAEWVWSQAEAHPPAPFEAPQPNRGRIVPI
ncbi:MAG: hypothetical protein HOO96_05090 [Polyangiaceae bacterium]|nr:hypothetical protein [Polyangiaceae bacterium]